MLKNLLIILLIGLIAAVAIYVVFMSGMLEQRSEPLEGAASTTPAAIMSFEACAAAGYPLMESHPRRCATPDGRVFAEEITVAPTYVNADADMIEVFTPNPGGVVGKEFLVIGKARGNWYFEGSFPIEVIGADGNQIAGGVATAQGEWMTTDFVEFKTDLLDLPSAYMGPATLVLKKDNPSGDPARDASVSLPITIEY